MKRAVVWLCWGRSSVAEAAVSARSAPIQHLDRFLITDDAGASQAEQTGAFTSIVSTQFVHGSNLEKSRLIEFLPDGFESFLFLDADTRVLDDISLGFAKAERHGIAIAPAPNYNLGEFFGFGGTMAALGMQPAGQLIYNSGVIFFRLTTSVRLVLERWRDLCRDIGTKSGVNT